MSKIGSWVSDPTSHDVTENLTILVDDIKNPKYHGVFDAYKKTWRETYDPSKGFSWNSLARVKNFWRVSVIILCFSSLVQFSTLKG